MKTLLVFMSTLLVVCAMTDEDALIQKMESIRNNQQMLEDNLQKHQDALQQHIYEHQNSGRHAYLDPIRAGIDLNEELRSKPKRTLFSPVRQYVHHYKVKPVALKYVVGYHVPSNRYLPVRRPLVHRPVRPLVPSRPFVRPGFTKPDFQQIDTPSIRPPQKPEQGHSVQIPIHSIQGATVQVQAPAPSPTPAVVQPSVTPIQVQLPVGATVATIPAHIHPTQVHHVHPSHTHNVHPHVHQVHPSHVHHVHPSHVHYHHLVKPVLPAVQPTVVFPQTPIIKVPSITVNPVLPLPKAVFHTPFPIAVGPAPAVPAIPGVPAVAPAIPAVPTFPTFQYPNVFPPTATGPVGPILRGFPLQPTLIKPGHSLHTSYSATFPRVPIVQNALNPLWPNPAIHAPVPVVPNGPLPLLPNPLVPNHLHLIHNHIDLPHSHQIQHEVQSVPHLHDNFHHPLEHAHYPYKH